MNAEFKVPSWVEEYESDFTEFAWWDQFTDPYTDWQLPDSGESVDPFPEEEGNLPNREEADNEDAVLIQNGSPSAIISGTGGIYDNSGNLSHYLVYDAPTFDVGTVLFQLRSWGSHADVESARLYYRETENGLLQEAVMPTGGGFLIGSNGFDTFTAWEWDLSALSVFDYYITFTSADSSMSLKEVQLDTIDIFSRQLGYPLTVETNSQFRTIGEVDHHLQGQTDPALSYEIGATIELTPVEIGTYEYVFMDWAGPYSGLGDEADGTLTVTMEEGLSVSAIFSPTSYYGWSENTINAYLGDESSRYPATADPDHNGLINLLEYALGGEPEVAMDTEPVRPQVSVVDGHLHVTFRRQPAATDIEYAVMVSNDLATWHYNGDGTGTYTEELAESITLNDDGTETVTYRDLTPIPDGGARFISLDITETSS